ncbi:hypothetical protein BVRB_8g194950 [Beta vulgaris subsp. vulgaris]|nr:hypothetical protein BVRB_8g194950 [Beta vulgaris subsp. vulgaris]
MGRVRVAFPAEFGFVLKIHKTYILYDKYVKLGWISCPGSVQVSLGILRLGMGQFLKDLN